MSILSRIETWFEIINQLVIIWSLRERLYIYIFLCLYTYSTLICTLSMYFYWLSKRIWIPHDDTNPSFSREWSLHFLCKKWRLYLLKNGEFIWPRNVNLFVIVHCLFNEKSENTPVKFINLVIFFTGLCKNSIVRCSTVSYFLHCRSPLMWITAHCTTLH